METALKVEGRRGAGQDRVALIETGSHLVAVVADGAGGTSGGAEAAQTVIERVRQGVEEGRELNERGLRQLLLEISAELENRGQTTAVVLAINAAEVVGAAVGDSGAWLVEKSSSTELTLGQPRKPLLGGGFAEPLTFRRRTSEGELLIATDGLLKYANGETVRALLRDETVSADGCCEALIDAARLPNGELQDDVALVLVRLRPDSRLVKELREWSARGGEATREVGWNLERFIREIFPASPLGAGTDGVEPLVMDEHHDDTVLISGSIWSIAPMKRYPFRARLELRRDRIEDYEVQVGEEDDLLVATRTESRR